MPRCAFGGLMLSASLMGSAAAAAVADVPPPFRPTVACMVRALAGEPHVSDVTAGVSDAQLSLDRPGVLHPFVAYRTVGRDGLAGDIRFDAEVSGKQLSFMTMLQGIYGVGQPGPDNWGTSRVMDLWKARCGVEATAIYN